MARVHNHQPRIRYVCGNYLSACCRLKSNLKKAQLEIGVDEVIVVFVKRIVGVI